MLSSNPFIDAWPAAPRSQTQVTQRALQRIQAMLRSADFPPGTALPSQRILAEQLQVSRASLREALSILETIGAIRTEHGRGTFVAEPEGGNGSPAAPAGWRFAARYSAEEVYEFRLTAEPRAATLAALRMSDADLGVLEETARLFKQATRDLDLVASSQADYDFHHQIMRFSRNRLLLDLHRSFRGVVLESQRLPLARRNRLYEPVLEHERILKALSMHDADGAGYYMRVHIARAADRSGVELVDVG